MVEELAESEITKRMYMNMTDAVDERGRLLVKWKDSA